MADNNSGDRIPYTYNGQTLFLTPEQYASVQPSISGSPRTTSGSIAMLKAGRTSGPGSP